MARVICDMSTSLDGYVTGPNDSRENPFGDGAEMLHDWIFKAATDEDRALLQELLDDLGAIVMGRTSFDKNEGDGGWGDSGPVGDTPCFVVTHRKPTTAAMLERDRPRRLTASVASLAYRNTRNPRCVAAGVINARMRSRLIAESRVANRGVPPPSRTGITCTRISSTRPSGSAWCMTLAPCRPTTLSPAACLACSIALTTPSVTNV